MPLPFFVLGVLMLTGAAAGAYRRLQRNAASCESCGAQLTAMNEGSCAACGSEICLACLREPEPGSPMLSAMRPASPLRYPVCPGCARGHFHITSPEERIEPPPSVSLALTDSTVGLRSTTEGTINEAPVPANDLIHAMQSEVTQSGPTGGNHAEDR